MRTTTTGCFSCRLTTRRSRSAVPIRRGIPEDLRPAAAALYWQAFGTKLARVLGPRDRAVDFLTRNLRPDNAIAAIAGNGQLLGLVAFQTPAGAFTDFTVRSLAVSYGWPGALWRVLVLWMLKNEVDNARFLIDGLCVAPAARGQGVGSRLLSEAAALAAERDYREIRLEVTDTNPRARALYQRLGFVPLRTERLGLLRYVFGFEAATTMVRPVAEWPAT